MARSWNTQRYIMKKIYLAGPEVFLENAIEMGKQKQKLCELYGFTGLYPLDNSFDPTGIAPQQLGLEIAKANEQLIEEGDAVIANMTPFRNTSCDVGTAYEMGYGRGLGKPVFTYTNDKRLFIQRNMEELPASQKISDQQYVDGNNMVLENFGQVDNLMLDGAVSDNVILHELVEKDQVFTELLGFEQCLKQLCTYFNKPLMRNDWEQR